MILLDLFTSLYESIIGTENTGLDVQDAFQGVGWITFFLSVFMAICFYLILGRWKAVWCKKKHWYLTLAFNSVLCSAIVFLVSRSSVVGFSFEGYFVKFALLNPILGDAIFIITSVIIKRWSKWSKYVPF